MWLFNSHIDSSHQEKQISYQDDSPTSTKPLSPQIPGFFVIMGYHKDATKRMIGVYAEVCP
ncbi:hypothetical protein FZ929_11065 [Klebsiella pneumoniae]|uniref:Uncharacterized protein n=1 Tax=Klebsiella pneumoniae TaxID=573 RepID=A0A5C2LGW9_KLEPN|nr:hypothetical protein FZ929_11065 [Klebsiella pneumoniae]